MRIFIAFLTLFILMGVGAQDTQAGISGAVFLIALSGVWLYFHKNEFEMAQKIDEAKERVKKGEGNEEDMKLALQKMSWGVVQAYGLITGAIIYLGSVLISYLS